MRYKNYKNESTGDNRIYSRDEMLDMPLRQIRDNQKEYLSQYRSIGVPSSAELQASSNVVWVDEYTRDDGTKVSGHWRSKPDGVGSFAEEKNGVFGTTIVEKQDKPVKMNATEGAVTGGAYEEGGNPVLNAIYAALQNMVSDESEDVEDGAATGFASKVDRLRDQGYRRQNNDELFDSEVEKPWTFLMAKNHEMNSNRPDAKLFMDLALIRPKQVPSCRDYQFIDSKNVPELNRQFALTGNKEIPSWYDGFSFSKDSPTAQRLNSSEEFKAQLLKPENYNAETGTFRRDKLEIEFKDDKNLQYSFGHMTVLNPKITKDGYIEGLGYDKYDYEWLKQDGSEAVKLNNYARDLQLIQHLRNYFILIPIRVKL